MKLFVSILILATTITGCLKKKMNEDVLWTQESLLKYSKKLETNKEGFFKFDILKKIKKKPQMSSFFIQAPHTKHDKHTGTIAKMAYGSIMADFLFTNSKHRKVIDLGKNNTLKNPLIALTRVFSENSQKPTILQFHGFEVMKHLEAKNKGIDIILSTGTKNSTPLAKIKGCINGSLEFKSGLYPNDIKLLGGTKNVLNQYCKGKCKFIHIEMSREFREFLIKKENRNESDKFFECFLT